MLNQPTSSDMMTTMFGFLLDEASWAWTAVGAVAGPAMASNLALFKPSEQLACGASCPPRPAGTFRALADRWNVKSLVAATWPRTAPAVMSSSAEIRFRFMRKTPWQGCEIVRAWSRDSVRRDRQDNNPASHHRKGLSVDSEAVPFQTLARPIQLHHVRSLRAGSLHRGRCQWRTHMDLTSSVAAPRSDWPSASGLTARIGRGGFARSCC